jgi:hypothetical protein
MVETNNEFIMEVTDKTRADIKGGTLIDYEGKPKLLEIAQVPENKVDEFKSIKKFKIFNTNNLWIRLDAIKRLIDSKVLEDMDIIQNQKSVNGASVIQLERAAGAAMQYFQQAQGVNVPRSRFLPVKSCSDLFVVQSNLYSLSNGSLVMNPARQFTTVPFVKLGEHFNKVDQYKKRFKGIPDMLVRREQFHRSHSWPPHHSTTRSEPSSSSTGTRSLDRLWRRDLWRGRCAGRHCHHRGQPRLADRHSRRRRSREQGGLWQPQDPRPLNATQERARTFGRTITPPPHRTPPTTH